MQNAVMAPADELRRQIRTWALRSGVDLRAVAQVCPASPRHQCHAAPQGTLTTMIAASYSVRLMLTVVCRYQSHTLGLQQNKHVLTAR